MYKNQLQELAQRSCFNLPSYTCFREGPDHAPRFKATVNFNGETFESPSHCCTLRQAEHSAAEVALNALAGRGPSSSLAARILDETGVYKNLLQEVSQRVGASLPAYTTFRSGLGHLPVFTCTVELAGVAFTGEPAKNKKQAEKNAAMAAWSSLKLLSQQSESSTLDKVRADEQEHVTVARALQKFLLKARMARLSFPIKFPTYNSRPSTTPQSSPATSKILPLICPRKAPRNRPTMPSVNSSLAWAAPQGRHTSATINDTPSSPETSQSQTNGTTANERPTPLFESQRIRTQKFPAAGAAPYIPIRHLSPHHGLAPPVTIRNAIPVFSAPPLPPPSQSPRLVRAPSLGIAEPVCIRQAVPVYAAPPVRAEKIPVSEELLLSEAPLVRIEEPPSSKVSEARVTQPDFKETPVRIEELPYVKAPVRVEETIGSKALPATLENSQVSESSLVQNEAPAYLVSAGTEDSRMASVEDTSNGSHDKLHESVKIEGLKQLKI